MRRRWPAAVVIAALCGAAALPPACAQAEAVTLALKGTAGEVYYFASSAAARISVDIGAAHMSSDTEVTARTAVRVLDVDQEGSLLMEAVGENMQVTAGGQTRPMVDTPVTLRVRPDGTVLERVPADAPVGADLGLPDRPVAVGDSWTRQEEETNSGIAIRGTVTSTLARIDQAGDGQVARVRSTLDGVATGGDLPSLPPGVHSRFRGKVHGTDETDWSVERGRALRSTTELIVDGTVEVTAQGRTVRGALKTAISLRRDPLAAESVVLPAIAQDKLITPGQGIGDVSLDQSVEALNARLGSQPEPPAALPAALVIAWPNGVQGYADPADPNILLGLQSGGSEYRTGKGIGFGSSQGAVLLAYGLSPARMEMPDPENGSVRVLIYDDQGIAFAIAAGTGPQPDLARAPPGTVAWIIVFAPGSAAKIFPH